MMSHDDNIVGAVVVVVEITFQAVVAEEEEVVVVGWTLDSSSQGHDSPPPQAPLGRNSSITDLLFSFPAKWAATLTKRNEEASVSRLKPDQAPPAHLTFWASNKSLVDWGNMP